MVIHVLLMEKVKEAMYLIVSWEDWWVNIRSVGRLKSIREMLSFWLRHPKKMRATIRTIMSECQKIDLHH